MFNELTNDERQAFARTHTDSAERWLRHLAHIILSSNIGPQYITQGTWKKDLKQKVATKIEGDPTSFQREIDATTFDQLIDIVCHPHYWGMFEAGLAAAYPDGVNEARTFLTRIQDIRNDVAHLRSVSVRQLEQALCYSNDIAESIKTHFQEVNMSKEFYVPTFISYADSLGNSGHFQPEEHYFRGIDLSTGTHKRLYPGDTLTVELSVDPSFDPTGYTVDWYLKTSPHGAGQGNQAIIQLTEAHVMQRMELQFRLKTTNGWHRSSSGYDDIIDIYYRVLPPI